MNDQTAHLVGKSDPVLPRLDARPVEVDVDFPFDHAPFSQGKTDDVGPSYVPQEPFVHARGDAVPYEHHAHRGPPPPFALRNAPDRGDHPGPPDPVPRVRVEHRDSDHGRAPAFARRP